MYIGVQGRLVRPQPVDYGVVRGLCAALCGRYDCLRYVAVGQSRQGKEIPALVLSQSSASQRVLMVSALSREDWWTALYALRLCEDMCSHLRAGLPLCQVPLRRALWGRQVWFIPLPDPDGADIYHNFTAGWEEMQVFGRKTDKIHNGSLADLCCRIPFRHVVVLGSGNTIGWYGGDAVPSQSELMAQVLSAVSGFPIAQPLDGAGFAAWFIRTFRRSALSLPLGRAEPHPYHFDVLYDAVREMLLLSTLF